LLVCNGVWIVILLGALLAAVLRYTVFGRYVFAIGSNEATARLCGVSVPRTKVIVYAIGGAFMALAGIFDFNNLSGQGNPTSGVGLELDMIAAVVIGGGSLTGGRGSVLGSIVGAVTMTTLRSGCVYASLSNPVQSLLIGAIIIAAVAIDQSLHRGKK
jgi:ribose/xylose/arabinose/galactoside ABC-type transport system permease subunit